MGTRPVRIVGRTSIALSALVVLAACGGAPDAPTTVDEVEPTETDDAGDADAREPPGSDGAVDEPAADAIPDALTVSGRRLDGGSYDLGQLSGSAVAIWMWAPW